MSKNVTFYLGEANGLATRQLTITQMPDAADDAYAASHDADAGASTTFKTVALDDSKIWQAKLVDTKSTGEASEPQIINFHTGDLVFPGKKTLHGSGSPFYIYAIEDLSSSSSSASSSSSSLSSSSSSSSSSSVSSASSISTSSSSSSSISTSSVSSSSSSASSASSASSVSSVSSSSQSSSSSSSSSASVSSASSSLSSGSSGLN